MSVTFFNAETKEPLDVMYVGSSRKGMVVVNVPLRMLSDDRPPNVVVEGPGTVRAGAAFLSAGSDKYRDVWSFTDLDEGSHIYVRDGAGKKLGDLPVRRVMSLKSYQAINKRLNHRRIKIDLDDHIDYVCYASETAGEGIAFRPKDAETFERAVKASQAFHHDDRTDCFGRIAASFTTGEGYREVSVTSLHVAISAGLSSVHIDSYAFMMRGPNGEFIISPEALMHIVDELVLRYPMSYLRRKGLTFAAALLNVLHVVLPHAGNGYSPTLGWSVELGGGGARNLRTTKPVFRYESVYQNVPGTRPRHWKHSIELTPFQGAVPALDMTWNITLRAEVSSTGFLRGDRQESASVVFGGTF